jgi:type II secretory pathway component PulC
MDTTLTSDTARALARMLAAYAGIHLGVAGAQTFSDPTQPPPSTPVPAAVAETAPALQLQAVIRGPGEQRTAIISGQQVRVGGGVATASGPALVAGIFDDRVLLIRGNTRETLSLLPSVATPATPSRGK